MTGLVSLIGTLLTLVLYILQQYFAAKQAHQQEKKNAANEISNAVASGDPAAINAAIERLRS